MTSYQKDLHEFATHVLVNLNRMQANEKSSVMIIRINIGTWERRRFKSLCRNTGTYKSEDSALFLVN